MRRHRTPRIGPRAVGITLIISGVAALILLALLSPVPAGAEPIETECLPPALAAPHDGGVICDPRHADPERAADPASLPETGTLVDVDTRADVFLLAAVITLAGGIFIELRPDRAR